MDTRSIKIAAAAGIAIATGSLLAGVPLNNLQGSGGIAFNPLAYTAGLPWDDGGGDSTNETERSFLDAAFAETGDKDKFYRDGSAKNLGVGSGAVFSVQYQF